MRKSILMLTLLAACLTGNAQNSKYSKPVDTTVQEEEQRPRRGLFDRNSDKEKEQIDQKYLEGACPTVNGKIQWQKYIYADKLSAKQIYDVMLPFLQRMCKEKEQTTKSSVAVVNEEEYQIGARFTETIVFQNTALSLDQTTFSYQLLVYCIDGRCEVVIRNMSYVYEADRAGGGTFPAEDMISDDNALNKKKTGFQKGGVKKFRMKTIDRRDEIFAKIEQALADAQK